MSYSALLQEYGISEETDRIFKEYNEDVISYPIEQNKTEIYNSTIDGLGLFATTNLERNEIIVMANVDKLRTPAGKYSNHSDNPNAESCKAGNNIYYIAKEDIKSGAEITIDYRHDITIRGL